MYLAGVELPFTVAIIPEVTYFVYKIALSILEPTVRLLIYRSVCIDVADKYIQSNQTIDNLNDTSPCKATLTDYPDLEDMVQSKSADYLIFSKILMNVPAIILGFFCGGWSDVVGRRLPMFITCTGSCIAVLFYILSLVVGGAAIPFILFATFVHSLFGRNSVITMAVHSSVIDLTTKEDRTKRLGRLLAMNFLGQFCGCLLLGILSERVSFTSMLVLVFFLFLLCCFLIGILLPETVTTASPLLSNPVELIDSSKELCQVHHIKDSCFVVGKPRPNQLRLYLIICLICLCVNQTCKAGEVDVTMLFVRHRPLNWDKAEYGYLLAVNFAAIGLSLLFVLPFLSSRLAIRDTTIIIGVVCFKIVRLFIMAFARQSWMVYFSVLLDSPIGMVISCLKSIISKIADESETGKAFAIQASIETASGMLGAMVFNSLYDLSFKSFIGTTFLVEGVIYIALLGIAVWMWKTLDGRYKTDYSKFNPDAEDASKNKSNDPLGYVEEEEKFAAFSSESMPLSQSADGGFSNKNASLKISSYGTTEQSTDWNCGGEYSAGFAGQQPEEVMSTFIDNTSVGAHSSGGHFVPISAPPTPHRSMQRAGEAPPAAIARPRPTSSLVRQQQNNNNEDQFGALNQYR